jgi:hypothetical protein
MADHNGETIENRVDLNSKTISELRTIAHTHISEIVTEDEQEQQNEMARQREAERYQRPSRKSRSKSKETPLSDQIAKAPRLRSAQGMTHTLSTLFNRN